MSFRPPFERCGDPDTHDDHIWWFGLEGERWCDGGSDLADGHADAADADRRYESGWYGVDEYPSVPSESEQHLHPESAW